MKMMKETKMVKETKMKSGMKHAKLAPASKKAAAMKPAMKMKKTADTEKAASLSKMAATQMVAKMKAGKKPAAKLMPKLAAKKASVKASKSMPKMTEPKDAKAMPKVSKAMPKAAKTLIHASKSMPDMATSLLKEGTKAPMFNAMTDAGEMLSLNSLKGKTVVLYFYPKDDTPGCTQESCDFRDSFTRLQKNGVVVLGVSKDSVKSHVKFKTKYSLPFSLLSDEDGKICEAYGVWKEKSMYGKKYMGIERSTFVIDGSGKIKKIFAKVSVTGHVDEVLQSL